MGQKKLVKIGVFLHEQQKPRYEDRMQRKLGINNGQAMETYHQAV
jgi:hypothetical protein